MTYDHGEPDAATGFCRADNIDVLLFRLKQIAPDTASSPRRALSAVADYFEDQCSDVARLLRMLNEP